MLFANDSPETVKKVIGKDKYSELIAKYGDIGGKAHRIYKMARVLDHSSPKLKTLEEESRNYYAQFNKITAKINFKEKTTRFFPKRRGKNW